MELHNFALSRNKPADVIDFRFERFEIGDCGLLIFLNDDIARAEKTKALAEREMHIKGYGGRVGFRVMKEFLEVGLMEFIVPDGRGGIACVSRTGTIVFLEKFLADFEVRHFVRGLHFRGHRLCVSGAAAACGLASENARAARTKAWAFATGVVGKIPWPRFRICPVPLVFVIASRTAHSTFSSVLKSIAGSTLPWSAIFAPIFLRASARSVRQSTLNTLAPVLAYSITGAAPAFSSSISFWVARSSNTS